MTLKLKKEKIQNLFKSCKNQEERYEKIIALGQILPSLLPVDCTEDRRVTGCQSRMFLKTTFKDNLIFFEAQSDALISQGLAAILIELLSGETPETILLTDIHFLTDIGIVSSLTSNRANGLFSLHLKMKQEALYQKAKEEKTHKSQ